MKFFEKFFHLFPMHNIQNEPFWPLVGTSFPDAIPSGVWTSFYPTPDLPILTFSLPMLFFELSEDFHEFSLFWPSSNSNETVFNEFTDFKDFDLFYLLKTLHSSLLWPEILELLNELEFLRFWPFLDYYEAYETFKLLSSAA